MVIYSSLLTYIFLGVLFTFIEMFVSYSGTMKYIQLEQSMFSLIQRF